jgi:thioredoxin reductase
MKDALIIGAGPGGVSCAIWLKQLGFNPLLVDRNKQCGGLQLRNPYTNTWIATSSNVHGEDVARAMQENVERHGVETALSTEVLSVRAIKQAGFEAKLSDDTTHLIKTVVLAGGVVPKSGGFGDRLGMIVGPGPKVTDTDFKGKRVAILGGGDSAFENYDFIRNRGAQAIRIFARSLRARIEMLSKVPIDDVELSEQIQVDHETNVVNGQKFDVILVLYGYEANAAAMAGLTPMLKPDGFVWTGAECETSIDGVYAVGEIARRAHPCCATAMADGVVAAKAIQRRLESSVTSQYLGMAKRAAGMLSMALK